MGCGCGKKSGSTNISKNKSRNDGGQRKTASQKNKVLLSKLSKVRRKNTKRVVVKKRTN